MTTDLLKLLVGDCRETLKTLPSDSVQCAVTSPPYWGLRDYGHADQIGQEKTPQEFVRTLCGVFAEVWRVLKPDGTLWLNLGDSYNAGRNGGHAGGMKQAALPKYAGIQRSGANVDGLKPKDLIGIPWRVAFALQEAGWWLRSDIIWAKRNCMPESVTDRPTRSHEYIFLLTKAERYYYDAEAVKEKQESSSGSFNGSTGIKSGANGDRNDGGRGGIEATGFRNKRSVWTVATNPYSEAHFATFPPALITPCILAGSRAGDTVLDPFGGSGTTGEVALSLGRKAILCELNPDYAKLIERRTDVTPGLAL